VTNHSAEPIPDKQQAENVKSRADKDYESGKMSGAKYSQVIARANKAGRKGRR
jgi:hypothetical protein